LVRLRGANAVTASLTGLCDVILSRHDYKGCVIQANPEAAFRPLNTILKLLTTMTDQPKISPDENPDRKDIDVPDELKATWDEKEKLRPALTLEEVADQLTGNGVLRHI
jgi:hypothetical protein